MNNMSTYKSHFPEPEEKTEDEILDEVLFDMYPGCETEEELEAAIEDNAWGDD